MSETADPVSIRIDNALLGFSALPVKPSIFRVDYMKRANDNLQDPKLVSIGPLHHGEYHLRHMEHYKFRYLKLLLQRQIESTVNKYVLAIRPLEEQARRCYADPVEFSPDEFVEMLLLDGCFIVEFVRKYMFRRLRERDDPILKYDHILYRLVRDLMLVENQVPFFVLDQLFNMTKTGTPNNNLISLIQFTFGDIYPWPGGDFKVPVNALEKNVDHLLDLMYTTWSSSFAEMTMGTGSNTKLDINSATELQEVGIELEKDTTRKFLEIKFVKGVLSIPTKVIWDETESVLRNLILYEQFSKDNIRPNYVTDYALFMYCLINSSKDVKILRLRGILPNMFGNDDMLHHMFKRLSQNVSVSINFTYADIFDKVNEHCRHRRNRWMANLRRDYFNNPWAFISFLGAIVLLFLTLLQAVFSVLSYAKD